MIAINWQQIIAYILLGGSGIGGLIWGGKVAWTKFRSTKTTAAERKADEQPPEGAVEWVKDIVAAMGKASSDSILLALTTGYTRAEAQQMRIVELEAKP